MILPCTDCKHRNETRQRHRVFIGCKDPEKEKGFKEDTYWYHHKCSNYEKEIVHKSDCAIYNEPAYPNEKCDCGAAAAFAEKGETTNERKEI